MRQVTRLLRLSWVGMAAALVIAANPAEAQTQTCQFRISAPGPITSPITLSRQGIHCLMTDLSTAASFTTGNAIEIAASNVVLDLNGHMVQGLAAGPGTKATGIHAFQRKNITIKNGTVRGFSSAIVLEEPPPRESSGGHRIEGIRAEGNITMGLNVQGLGNIVRGNQVVRTGGFGGIDANGTGIFVAGPGSRVVDNDVIETLGNNNFPAFAIHVISASSSVVEGNRVSNRLPFAGSFGVLVDSQSQAVLVVDNRIVRWDTGISVDTTDSSARCRDNFFTPTHSGNLVGCEDVANNN